MHQHQLPQEQLTQITKISYKSSNHERVLLNQQIAYKSKKSWLNQMKSITNLES